MARIYFACPLDEFRPNWYRPLIVSVLMPVGQPMNLRWATADGKSGKNWSIGVVEATPEQIAAINANTTIIAMTASEINAQFQSLSQPRKNKINAFMTQQGLALPNPTESIRSVFQRVINTLDTVTIGQMDAQLT